MCIFSYSMGYETLWKPETVRKPKMSGHNDAAIWENLPRCRATVESVLEFCGAMVSMLPQTRSKGDSESSQVGSPLVVDFSSKRKAGTAVAERSRSGWTYHGLVDPKACCTFDSGELRSALHRSGGVETFTSRSGLELPEAGKAGSAKRRKRHCLLEDSDMAWYKKKPENLDPIWPSSMKVGSCSSLTFVGLGLLWGARRFCVTATSETKSRSSEALPYLLSANVLDCMSASIPITSPARKSSLTCSICCVICAGMWS